MGPTYYEDRCEGKENNTQHPSIQWTCFYSNNTQVRNTLYLTFVKSQLTLVSTYWQQPLEKNRRSPEKSYSVGAEEKTQRTEL
jgi:hypothetical protein